MLEAAGARKIVEVGALAGQTTELMLQRLGPQAELHVVDPVPQFDPSEHERKFGGQYIFHRDLSLNVLGKLEPMDAALLDGDHNWYTVRNELEQLADVARETGTPLPVLVLHDVCFPYGRRDLYYAPDEIPEEFRQPYAQRGINPTKKKLVPRRGGMNPTMHNAVTEGGPRNGVMTGIEDFIEAYEKPLRTLVLPIYFGLAIIVEEERLATNPDLARVLDELEGAERRQDLLELAEETRIQSLLFQHNMFYTRERQLREGAARYLGLLKGALLDDHYFENEVRIDYLLMCIEKGREVEARKLRDPKRMLKNRVALIRRSRESGADLDGGPTNAGFFPYTEMGRVRLEALEGYLDTIREERVEGDLVDCGTLRGGAAILMRGYLEAHAMTEESVYVADPFDATITDDMALSPEGSADQTPTADDGGRASVGWFRRRRDTPPAHETESSADGRSGLGSLPADLNNVRDAFSRFDLLDDRVSFLQGQFDQTLAEPPMGKIALLRIGATAGAEAGAILERLYDRLTIGGFVVVDGYADPECRKVIDQFRSERGINDTVELTDHHGARWRKLDDGSIPSTNDQEQEHAAVHDVTRDLPTAAEQAAGSDEEESVVPIAPKDLSVVVVFYNMKRESARTLRSLTRSYQQGADDLDYEVIVVENGSAPDEKLGEDYVRSFGPEFRYIDVGDTAEPSPVGALNRGIAASGGANVALMIDGAHVLTPGVLRFGMDALGTYEPAIVATQQWYVGPGQQGDLMTAGYDQAMEDELFERIEWPADGYKLFEIGHFIGERDWLDGMWESNCLFVPRALIEQSGAFDPVFDTPGGGYANLDIFERLGSTPDVTVSTILGEGSFHQIHQGTTTNQAEVEQRHTLISTYAIHYEKTRGKPFTGPGKQVHYVGKVFDEARRTRARRHVAREFWTPRYEGEPDGLPPEPTPIPQEISTAYTEAYWRSLAWQGTTWLGESAPGAPSDLVIYQEILASVRPDWIIDTFDADGGRSLFWASMCDLLDHGKVLSLGAGAASDKPTHERLEYVSGKGIDETTQNQVRELVGDDSALVFLGGPSPRQRLVVEFEAFAPLVPVGSYVIVQDTVLNGHPVWPAFGPGPQETIRQIKQRYPEFMSDLEIERSAISFNPAGYLKRVR